MARFIGRNVRLLTSIAMAFSLAACAGIGKQKDKEALEKDLESALASSAASAEASYNYPEAVQSYAKLVAKHPDDVDLALKLARNLRFAGQAQQDIAIVTQLIGKSGRTVPLLLELGKAQQIGRAHV